MQGQFGRPCPSSCNCPITLIATGRSADGADAANAGLVAGRASTTIRANLAGNFIGGSSAIRRIGPRPTAQGSHANHELAHVAAT